MGHVVKPLRIGLLGATGLIAQELASHLRKEGHQVVGFTRTSSDEVSFLTYSKLSNQTELSAIVNLVGGHSKNSSAHDGNGIREIDVLASEWAESNNKPYIYVSSGAIFGTRLPSPVSDSSPMVENQSMEPYASSKVQAELRHETLRERGTLVSDLRLFSYAGPEFISMGNYFLSRLFRAAEEGREFEVRGPGFIRDYIGVQELWQAIEISMSLEVGVKANLFSNEPVSRVQLLDLTRKHLGLKFKYSQDGSKDDSEIETYYSKHSKALMTYTPRKSSTVVLESLLAARALSQGHA